MHRTRLNGIEIEYEARGSGEAVLFIGTGPFADSFLPMMGEPALAGAFRLVRYRQRGQSDPADASQPVGFARHAADAAALIAHLGLPRVHVAGHSTGAAIALQLAADRPEVVQSLALLEPPLMGVLGAASFMERIQPALAAFAGGDAETAMRGFLRVVCSRDESELERVVERRVPGGMARALAGAPTFFGSYLAALQQWDFGAAQAAAIDRPVLAVVGSETDPLFAQGGDLIRAWFPHAELCRIEGAAHLLHLERPTAVARGLAAFFAAHPIAPGADVVGAAVGAPPA